MFIFAVIGSQTHFPPLQMDMSVFSINESVMIMIKKISGFETGSCQQRGGSAQLEECVCVCLCL